MNILNAEQALLGAMMADNSRWAEVSDMVGSQDFLRDEHGLVFRCMDYMIGRNQPCDIVTLCQTLEDNRQLEKVGGMANIGAMARNCPSAVNAMTYARMTRDASRLRRIGVVTQNVANRCANGGEDPSTLLATCITELTNMMTETEAPGLRPIAEFIAPAIDRIEKAWKGGGIAGLPTGIGGLDNLTGGLMPGELIVVAGRPGMGKTALSMAIATLTAKTAPVAVFSMEMPGVDIVQRIIAAEGGASLHKMRNGRIEDADWPLITSGIAFVKDSGLLLDDSAALDAMQICSATRICVSRVANNGGKVSLVVIDFLQRMRIHPGRGNMNEALESVTRELKALAMDVNVPVVLLSQLSRESEKRPGGRPRISDLRGSGGIEQDADKIIFVHRPAVINPDTSDEDVLILAKNRNGPLGDVMVDFDGPTLRFTDRAALVVDIMEGTRKEDGFI